MRHSKVALAAATIVLAGCGGAKHAASMTAPTQTAPPKTTTSSTTTAASSTSGPGALQGEALANATGDIPDNQVFVGYSGHRFSMKVPEGWAQSGKGGAAVTFRDKNNIVRVVVAKTKARFQGLALTTQPHSVSLPSGTAAAATYRTTSSPNAVTGKRVTLTVDRYVITHRGGLIATVDLGTPVGVDNVDAYRLMIRSFRWR